jgi:hypothetical protein
VSQKVDGSLLLLLLLLLLPAPTPALLLPTLLPSASTRRPPACLRCRLPACSHQQVS